MTTLKAKDIAKSYSGRQVVKGMNIDVNSGEIVGLLGPNGAGKTTSFYMIVGLVPCDSGHISLDKQNITDLPMHARAQLGISYLPQEASVFRKLSVSDNILAILEMRKELSKDKRYNLLEQLLEEFNITHVRDNLGMSLSGGERRRVEIARALAIEPAFILLDEPFAGVDPISVIDIKQIIQHLAKRGIGVLITDHNVRETLDICERAYIMSEGQMLCMGNAKEILSNQKVRDVYLGEEFALS